MNSLRIVYFGSPDFAVAPLERIIEAGYQVAAVVTNRDKPVGRKAVLTPTPVKVAAQNFGLKVFEYASVRKEGVADLKNVGADLFITCAFGQILSQEVLDIPRLYTLNIHGSLLPEYRGAAPVQRAVIDGREKTGVTIMRTDAGIDTGDIMFMRETEIGVNETAGELFKRLSVLGADCIIDALKKVESGAAVFTPQAGVSSYAKMIEKADGRIDFTRPASEIKNLVRGLNPSPSAYAVCGGAEIKIHAVEVADGSGAAGEILCADKKFEVACGVGSIIITDLTKQGGKRMGGADFLRGAHLTVGGFLS